MVSKRYTQSNNVFTEDENGICRGIEETDASGNFIRAICANFPTFSPEQERVDVTYIKQLRANGTDDYLHVKSIPKTIDASMFYCGDIESPSFGQPVGANDPGAVTAIRFFAKIFYGEYEGVNMATFIDATLSSIITG
jgi:hypothetical protein